MVCYESYIINNTHCSENTTHLDVAVHNSCPKSNYTISRKCYIFPLKPL